MPINPHDAEQRIREAIARRAAEETILVPIEKPDAPILEVDPNKRLLYLMLRQNNHRFGGGEYAAIHPESHEARFLGARGE